ncbi:MAG: Uma2 family endonuclease [Dermatophilus congolensis]|nr:Uma2 family endonuclease [Dermatophilus congolensis]
MSTAHEIVIPTEPISLAEWERDWEPLEDRWELVAGIPVMAAQERPINIWIADRISDCLKDALGRRWTYLQHAGVLLADDPRATVRGPDLAVVRPDTELDVPRLDGSSTALVVEVLSPSTRRTDLVRKRREYATAEIPAYLVVDKDAPEEHRFLLLTDPESGDYATQTRGGDIALTIEGTSIQITTTDLER